MAVGIFIIAVLVLAALVTTVIALLVLIPRLGVIVLALSTCVIAIAVLTFKIVHKPRLLRFADEVKHVINPNDLQQWAILTLGKADANSSEIPLKDVPVPIQEIKFDGCTIEMAFFDISPKSENNCIHLMWGGGFGHWGIDVGAPSFEQPNDDHNNYVKWIPGVYFSEER